MRLTKTVALTCAALCACAAILLQLSAGATAAARHALPPFDPATQSHPGACSQNTLDVTRAVSDLSANGILGQYAAMVGVHATGSRLRTQMRQTLVVLRVAGTTTTANHGCTTDGVIFPVGPRTLTRGETVGVALPAKLRATLCRGSASGCLRKVLTVHTVFPTNCWNLDTGTIRVVVYVHRPHAKTKAKVLLSKPSAHVSTACGTGNSGTSTVTLRNGSGASASADFVVNGKHYGPVRPGHSVAVQIALGSGSTAVRVSSGGEVLVNQQVPADPCPVPPPPAKPVPSASAVLSCAAGGVVVTLSNAAGATADATFQVNGTSYGPLAPGTSRTVTIAVPSGQSATVTVTSGGTALLSGAAYANSCTSAPSALADVRCTPPFTSGGGTLVVQLANGAGAALPATFTVTAVGNTTAGYGPTTTGPLAVGGTQTLDIPVDGSGASVTVTITSGGTQLLNEVLVGCQSVPAE